MTKSVCALVSIESVGKRRPEVKSVQHWKFVVVTHSWNLVVIAGPVSDFPYHANLLAQYCDQHNIPSGWTKKPDWVEVFDRSVKIRGGGHMHIDTEKRLIQIYGRSSVYGPFSASDLSEMTQSDPFFAGFKVDFPKS